MTPERIAGMREAIDARPDVDILTLRRTTFLALLDIAERFARLQPAAEAACDAYGKTGGRIIPTMEALAKALETP